MLQDILIKRKIYASEEHKMMQQMVNDFITNEVIDQLENWEKEGMVSRKIWHRAGELGLLCMDMPVKYGGGGLDFTFNAFKKYLPACPAEGTKPPRIILRVTSGPNLVLDLDMYELYSYPSESISYP